MNFNNCVQIQSLPTELEQNLWICFKIKELLQQGTQAKEIAIISRKHKDLLGLLPFLEVENIPFFYQKNQNILEQQAIVEIITILEFIFSLNSLNSMEQIDADHLLPEILAYDFWQIDKLDIWKISVVSYYQLFEDRQDLDKTKSRLWLQTIQNVHKIEADYKLKDPQKIQKILDFFLALAKKSVVEPAEKILDLVIGTSFLDAEQNLKPTQVAKPEDFVCPYKNYYFDKKSQGYLKFLSHLRVFVDGIREYRQTQNFKLKELLEYISLLKKNNLKLIDNSYYNTSSNGVNLLTAHGSKGLEFEKVFVINCQKSNWEEGQKNTLSWPKNLPLSAVKDTSDDFIRLFFVALTRAKDNLYLTNYQLDNKGKQVKPLTFISDVFEDSLEAQSQNSKSPADNTQPSKEDTSHKQIDDKQQLLKICSLETEKNSKKMTISFTQEKFLASLLENYKMSATHLQNFLNVAEGGPQKFLDQNLLRFPQSKVASAGYGTAMNLAVSYLENSFFRNGQKPSLDKVKQKFESYLQSQRLVHRDFENNLVKGWQNLEFYYQNQDTQLLKSAQEVKFELSFARQNVRLNRAILSGNLDKVLFLPDKKISIVDYKTGKPLKSFEDNTNNNTKIKSWKYRTQLTFYKILIQNSRDFRDHQVQSCSLEFLDSGQYGCDQVLTLSKQIGDQELLDLTSLIEIVHQKILNLDFPDIQKYSTDYKGILDFIADLQAV